jgi:hypothetical protein
MILNKTNYGSNFNIIKLDNNIIIKENKNEYGYDKLLKEINFYKYILDNNIINNMLPKIIDIEINNKKAIIKMEYLKNYTELYNFFFISSYDKQLIILDNIFMALNNIHNCIKINIDYKKYNSNLFEEVITKINLRLGKINHIIKEYSYIAFVNNVKLNSINEIMNRLENNIRNYSKETYSLIHGDCQFSNILIDDNYNIKFIDPRGYFGETDIFGMPEYDYAKVFFALSGYDLFDNNEIANLNIINDHIFININTFDLDLIFNKFSYYPKNIILTLVIAIWLGNSHIYMDNIFKCITSYYIALYYGSIWNITD